MELGYAKREKPHKLSPRLPAGVKLSSFFSARIGY